MQKKKLFIKMIRGKGKNILFNDFIRIVEAFGFVLDRINGSHHIYIHTKCNRLISVQSEGKDAKPYQVKQFISLVERFHLRMEE
jgi:predicted RNA binding protein YcfA (HicA-like mRNA interferase family)